MEKREIVFKNPENYEGLSVEYPPKPPFGTLKEEDLEYRDGKGELVEGQEYIDWLYEFIKKSTGF